MRRGAKNILDVKPATFVIASFIYKLGFYARRRRGMYDVGMPIESASAFISYSRGSLLPPRGQCGLRQRRRSLLPPRWPLR